MTGYLDSSPPGEQQINIRLDPSDAAKLGERAEVLGMSRTTLCRAILLSAAEGDLDALRGLMVPR